ncbi:MAG TPA: site-2 protease family protein [Acidobacteriaceae bacterium]|nr:site-2 protease family protein [Acidobacteriaceae bacterium]
MPLTIALVIFELVVMVLSISLHDSAQAWTANRLGDPTARMMGRISLNPAKHFDLFGMLIWPVLFIFQSPLVLGWGKPVPMTPRNFRRPSRDEMVATLAGPGVQLLAALVALLILVILRHTQSDSILSLTIAKELGMRNLAVPLNNLPAIFPLYLFLYFCILVNLLLFVFNLIPLPFLDGGKILMHYLSYNAAKTYQSLSMWMMIGFFFLGFYVIMILFAPLMTIFNQLLFTL